MIAERFRVLGEPARLRLLNVLRGGERTVTQLVEETGLTQTNTSKHLRLMRDVGLVVRRRTGLHVRYAITDARVFRLCDVMCDQLRSEVAVRHRIIRSA